MKPGSSDRCKNKKGIYRCNRHHHDAKTKHQARIRKGMLYWE